MNDKKLGRCVAVKDVRLLARSRLPQPVFDLIDGGSGDEITMRSNETAFAEIELAPRYARDVSHIQTAIGLLGTQLSFPLILAPTGVQGTICKERELAPARAAAKAGLMYSLSTFSTASLEEVAEACPGAKMFQLYVLNDDAINLELIDRAKAAGYHALCITIDAPVNAGMERMKRWAINPVRGLPPFGTMVKIAQRPLWCVKQGSAAREAIPDVAKTLAARGHVISPEFFDRIIRKDLTWETIAQIARRWDGPLLIKGILTPDDALHAANAGATAIAVCNHGGTNLDGAPASIRVLEAIADAVQGRVEIVLAGGIRRGGALLKAIGLGAAAGMIGRPFLYGMAASGEEGVTRVIDILREEFEIAMKLCGITNVSAIDRTIIHKHAGNRLPSAHSVKRSILVGADGE